MDCDANMCAQLTAAGYNIVQDVADDGTSHFKWIEEWTMSSYKEIKYDYYMLAERLKKRGFGIIPMETTTVHLYQLPHCIFLQNQ